MPHSNLRNSVLRHNVVKCVQMNEFDFPLPSFCLPLPRKKLFPFETVQIKWLILHNFEEWDCLNWLKPITDALQNTDTKQLN